MAATDGKRGGLGFVLDYFREFRILKDNPREYWGIQAINFLDCTAYFALITVITLYLSNDLGMSDENAGYVVTIATSAVTLLLLVSGLVSDWLGVRKALLLAMLSKGLLTLGMGTVGLLPPFPGRAIVVSVCFILMAPSFAMVQTVFQSANRRYSTSRSRSASFNLWYLFMNVGAVASGLLIDGTRLWMEIPHPNAWLVLFGVLASGLSIAVQWRFVRSEAQAREPGADAADSGSAGAKGESAGRQGPMAILRAVVREKAFWRFMVLMVAFLGVQAVYVHMYLLMPKYWERVIGADANIGLLNTINPILIVSGLILVIPIANRINVFNQLVFGAMVSAAAIFALVVPWRWLSSDVVTAHYVMAIASMVFVSLGEVFWSPKLNEYAASIAPEGQEGTYLGMSQMPWFGAKVIVSFLSGHMLTRWCPEGIGERMREGELPFWDSPAAMWFVLALWAFAGPIVVLFLRRWMTEGARWARGEG